ncbi:MAG: polyprenyl synthetase family protein [Pseudoflavonifractor sp.]|nr:polyprenyl synthetase family protein [Pseudoflavonifractor sp.]
MTTIEAIQQPIAPQLVRLNERIADSLASPNPLMAEIISNYLKTKGKQIRPILVLLSARFFGEINDDAISAAAAIEMLHNASLIHDDVVDEARKRRGYATINSVWDNHIAVLVGDYFVSTALQEGTRTSDMRVIRCLSALGRELSIGEVDQICNARAHTLDERAYFSMIERKTASLFMSCVRMGGYAAGASDADLDIMVEFARLLGLCFQIKDDIFDYFEDGRVGKPTGNDLREGKITLPLLYALSRDDRPDAPAMVELSRRDELTSGEIARLIDYAKRAGGIEYAEERMRSMRDEGVALISRFPDSPARRAFISLFDYIIDRDH